MNPLAPVTKTFVRRPPMCSYVPIVSIIVKKISVLAFVECGFMLEHQHQMVVRIEKIQCKFRKILKYLKERANSNQMLHSAG